MIGFIIGLIIGGATGVMALCAVWRYHWQRRM